MTGPREHQTEAATAAADAISHVSAYPPLPAGMDPNAINDDVLREHGLPGRPDPKLQPQLLRQWNRMMARPTRFIRADLAIDPAMTKRHLQRDPLNPYGWGGVVRVASPGTDYSYPATMIFGEWVVPDVSGLAPDGASLEVGFWVGLDGYESEGLQVLKAGVTATVEQGWFSNSVEYRLFTEWYTEKYQSPAVNVQNLPIAPGDIVSVLVTANGPGSGTAFFRNSRSGLGASVAISQPPDIVSAGLTTEWIVEGLAEDLPWFAPVTFTNCWGASFIEGAGEYFNLEPGAVTTSIQGPLWGTGDVVDLTVTEITSPTVAEVKEVAVDWPGDIP
jgi:Peptidase A4 family